MNEFLLYLNFAGIVFLFIFILVWPKPDKRSDDLANHERSIIIQLSKKAIAKATGEQK